MMLTLARTGTVPETVEPELGEVIETTRLPRPGSCAAAWSGTNQAQPTMIRMSAAAVCLTLDLGGLLVLYGCNHPSFAG